LRGKTFMMRNGEKDVLPEIESLKSNVRAALAEGDRINALYGDELNVEESWLAISKAVGDLLSDKNNLTAEAEFQAYTAGITPILVQMHEVSHASNLTQDPELDSNILAGAMVVTAPKFMATLGNIRGLTAGLLISAPPSQWSYEQLEDLEEQYYRLDSLNEIMIQALEEAGNANERSRKFLDYYASTISPKLTKFEENFEDIVFEKNNGLPAEEFFQLATDTIDAFANLYDNVYEEFLVLLQQRERNYNSKKILILIASVTALLGFGAIFIFLYRTLRRTEDAEAGARSQNS
jgi:hypothetical protein